MAKRNLKPSLELCSKDRVALTEPVTLDSQSAGEDIVGEMIEEGLDVLGRNVGRVILHHLEVSYSLNKNEIARRPDLFVKALGDMFGEGSLTIERILVETISQKIGIQFGETGSRKLSLVVRRLRELQSYAGSKIYR